MAYPSSSQVEPIIPRPREGHRRRFSEADKRRIVAEAVQSGAGIAAVARRFGIDRRILRRWKQELAVVTAPIFVTVQVTDVNAPSGLAPVVAEAAS